MTIFELEDENRKLKEQIQKLEYNLTVANNVIIETEAEKEKLVEKLKANKVEVEVKFMKEQDGHTIIKLDNHKHAQLVGVVKWFISYESGAVDKLTSELRKLEESRNEAVQLLGNIVGDEYAEAKKSQQTSE